LPCDGRLFFLQDLFVHLNAFNHFRAVAILFIVAGHSFDMTGMQLNRYIDLVLVNLLKGGTALFVFISGFLFHHVFYPKFAYRPFVMKKVKAVFLPYMLLGLLPVTVAVLAQQAGAGYFPADGEGVLAQYLVPGLKYYLTGRFLDAYWYIPFIMVTFLLSPLHLLFIGLSARVQLGLVLLLSVVGMLLHRPVDNIAVWQSVLYYSPIYLMGIVASVHRAAVHQALVGRELYLLLAVVGLAVLQVELGHISNYHKPAFDYAGLDLMFVQKVGLCFFFMQFLTRFESYHSGAAHTLAATSFTVFFIHPLLLWWLQANEITVFQQNAWWVFVLFFAGLTLFCVLLATLCRRLFPRYSRYLIGY